MRGMFIGKLQRPFVGIDRVHVHVETTESMHVASYELTHRGGFVEMMRTAKRFAAAEVPDAPTPSYHDVPRPHHNR